MLRLALLALLIASPALAAGAFHSDWPFGPVSDWSVAAKSRARLIADADGAGFEISLAPGAITYWRDPGEAGVPPSFDFSGSTNLAKAEVDYPAPERIPEPDGSTAFGYREGVVFPIRTEATDPRKPMQLRAHVDYAVCEKICLPAKATAEIVVPASVPDFTMDLPPTTALTEARARVPRDSEPSALGLTVAPQGPKAWRLCLRAPPRDLFVEAPEGFWVQPKREADGRCYALSLQQAPDGAKLPIEVRVTIEHEKGAAETRVTLSG